MVKPRLLYLGHALPYPPDRGVALRSYYVLRTLASQYDVDVLTFHREGDPTQTPLESRIAHLRQRSNVEVFPVPREQNPLRRVWDDVRGLVLRRSAARWRYDSTAFRRRVLEQLFERDPQVIHVDSLALQAHLPLLEGRSVVLAHHHVESRRLRERAALVHGREQARLEVEAQWAERVERHWLPRAALNVACSESDRDALMELAPEARVAVVPLGVDTRHFTPGHGTGQGLAFVGGATGVANRDALEFFARSILPRLRRETSVQALEPISWVGSIAEGDRERYRELGIDLTGYVEDIRPIVRPAACYIVPARVGSGRATRILQAWAMGKAVVSTRVGCEGLAARDGENILIRDDAVAFAHAVADVLRDRDLRMRLGTAGRRTVEAHHDWAQIGAGMLDLYRGAENAGSIHRGTAAPQGAPPG